MSSTAPSFDEQPTRALPTVEALDGDLWPARSRRSGVRMRVPTAVLSGLLIAAAAFWGGTYLQKHEGTASRSAASTFPGLGPNSSLGRGNGFPGATGSQSNGTSGTLTMIQGNTLWVTTSTGSLVKVKLSKSTTVARNASASVLSLRPGDTVVVQGTTASGAVTASSVSATAKGVTSTTGFGSFTGAAPTGTNG